MRQSDWQAWMDAHKRLRVAVERTVFDADSTGQVVVSTLRDVLREEATK
jgi:Ca2+-binding EF-hand superfamily protein